MKVLFVLTLLFASIASFEAFILHPCLGKNKGEIVRGWESCRVIFICNGNNGGQLKECAKGFYFDMDKGYCLLNKDNKRQCKLNVFPWENFNPCQFHLDKQYYPMPFNCSKFYQCSNGKPVVQTCSDGLHFNPTLNVCDWPQDAGCRWANIPSED